MYAGEYVKMSAPIPLASSANNSAQPSTWNRSATLSAGIHSSATVPSLPYWVASRPNESSATTVPANPASSPRRRKNSGVSAAATNGTATAATTTARSGDIQLSGIGRDPP